MYNNASFKRIHVSQYEAKPYHDWMKASNIVMYRILLLQSTANIYLDVSVGPICGQSCKVTPSVIIKLTY